jgi:hypothetical protein
VTAPPEVCSSCGTPAEPGQEYCLECGARIVPVRRLSALGWAWERRFGRYPGDWIWASALLLLVAAGSAAAGIVAGRDTGTGTGSGSRTIVATSPVVIAPPAPPAPKPQPQPTTRPQTTPAPPAPKPRNQLTEWPARNGFTVVLASIPARGTGRADAEAKAKQALARGLRNVGVLTSNRFASLHPGYYVVFTGVYDSLEEAQTAAGQAAARFPNAYAREIAR